MPLTPYNPKAEYDNSAPPPQATQQPPQETPPPTSPPPQQQTPPDQQSDKEQADIQKAVTISKGVGVSEASSPVPQPSTILGVDKGIRSGEVASTPITAQTARLNQQGAQAAADQLQAQLAQAYLDYGVAKANQALYTPESWAEYEASYNKFTSEAPYAIALLRQNAKDWGLYSTQLNAFFGGKTLRLQEVESQDTAAYESQNAALQSLLASGVLGKETVQGTVKIGDTGSFSGGQKQVYQLKQGYENLSQSDLALLSQAGFTLTAPKAPELNASKLFGVAAFDSDPARLEAGVENAGTVLGVAEYYAASPIRAILGNERALDLADAQRIGSAQVKLLTALGLAVVAPEAIPSLGLTTEGLLGAGGLNVGIEQLFKWYGGGEGLDLGEIGDAALYGEGFAVLGAGLIGQEGSLAAKYMPEVVSSGLGRFGLNVELGAGLGYLLSGGDVRAGLEGGLMGGAFSVAGEGVAFLNRVLGRRQVYELERLDFEKAGTVEEVKDISFRVEGDTLSPDVLLEEEANLYRVTSEGKRYTGKVPEGAVENPDLVLGVLSEESGGGRVSANAVVEGVDLVKVAEGNPFIAEGVKASTFKPGEELPLFEGVGSEIKPAELTEAEKLIKFASTVDINEERLPLMGEKFILDVKGLAKSIKPEETEIFSKPTGVKTPWWKTDLSEWRSQIGALEESTAKLFGYKVTSGKVRGVTGFKLSKPTPAESPQVVELAQSVKNVPVVFTQPAAAPEVAGVGISFTRLRQRLESSIKQENEVIFKANLQTPIKATTSLSLPQLLRIYEPKLKLPQVKTETLNLPTQRTAEKTMFTQIPKLSTPQISVQAPKLRQPEAFKQEQTPMQEPRFYIPAPLKPYIPSNLRSYQGGSGIGGKSGRVGWFRRDWPILTAEMDLFGGAKKRRHRR